MGSIPSLCFSFISLRLSYTVWINPKHEWGDSSAVWMPPPVEPTGHTQTGWHQQGGCRSLAWKAGLLSPRGQTPTPLSRIPLQQRNLVKLLRNFLKLLTLTKYTYYTQIHKRDFVNGTDFFTLKLGFCSANCMPYEKYSSLATAIADKRNNLRTVTSFSTYGSSLFLYVSLTYSWFVKWYLKIKKKIKCLKLRGVSANHKLNSGPSVTLPKKNMLSNSYSKHHISYFKGEW